MSAPSSSKSTSGVLFALAAFLTWGFLPIYWKLLSDVPALQIMLNRIVWSLVFLALVLTVRKDWGTFLSVFRHRKSVLMLLCSSLLIATNWLIYIWSVNNEHIVESSLGYYINPLITLLLGAVFLRERLRLWQGVAVALALVGVMNSVLHLDGFPWIALSLAVSFSLYGLLRKVVAVESLVGLTFETALLTPLALGAMAWMGWKGDLHTGEVVPIGLLLAGAGVITALPLIWYTCGARRLQLSTIGFLQYLGPTTQLIIGIQVYGEPFPKEQLITFSLIWVALLLYSADALIQARSKRTVSPVA